MAAESTPERRRLTEARLRFFKENGYLIGLPPIYSPAEVAELNAGYQELLKYLRPGEDEKEIREWHESSRFLYDICVQPQIFDYVEDLLRANYYLWASELFCQSSPPPERAWLAPGRLLLAAFAAQLCYRVACVHRPDEGNSAMRVIPRSQSGGLIKHKPSSQTDSVLTLELERWHLPGRRSGSPGVESRGALISRRPDDSWIARQSLQTDWRIGFTIRYSGTNVKCDLSVNPHFKTYLMRGVDEYKHNPVGTIPTERFGRLERKHLSIEEAKKDEWHEGQPPTA